MPRIKDIGELNQRITIQIFEEKSDGLFGYEEVWTDWGTVWAKMDNNKSQPMKDAGQNTSYVTFSAIVRYNKALYNLWSRLGAHVVEIPGTDNSVNNVHTSRMRVNYGGRIFDVKSLFDPDGDGVWMEISLGETWRASD